MSGFGETVPGGSQTGMSGCQSVNYPDTSYFPSIGNNNARPVTCVVNMEPLIKSCDETFQSVHPPKTEEPAHFPADRHPLQASFCRPPIFSIPNHSGGFVRSPSPKLLIQIRKPSMIPPCDFSARGPAPPILSSKAIAKHIKTIPDNVDFVTGVHEGLARTERQSVAVSDRHVGRKNSGDVLKPKQEWHAIKMDFTKKMSPISSKYPEAKLQVQQNIASQKGFDDLYEKEPPSLQARAQQCWQTGLKLFQAPSTNSISTNVRRACQKLHVQQRQVSRRSLPFVLNPASIPERGFVQAPSEGSVFQENAEGLPNEQLKRLIEKALAGSEKRAIQLRQPVFTSQRNVPTQLAMKAMKNGKNEMSNRSDNLHCQNNKETLGISLNCCIQPVSTKMEQKCSAQIYRGCEMEAAHNVAEMQSSPSLCADDNSREVPEPSKVVTEMAGMFAEHQDTATGPRQEREIESLEQNIPAGDLQSSEMGTVWDEPEGLAMQHSEDAQSVETESKKMTSCFLPLTTVQLNEKKGYFEIVESSAAGHHVIMNPEKTFSHGGQKIVPRRSLNVKMSKDDMNMPSRREKPKKKRTKSEGAPHVSKAVTKEHSQNIRKEKSVTTYSQETTSDENPCLLEENGERQSHFATVPKIDSQGMAVEFPSEEKQKDADDFDESEREMCDVEKAHGYSHRSGSKNLVRGAKNSKPTKPVGDSKKKRKNLNYLEGRKAKRRRNSLQGRDTDEEPGYYVCSHCRRIFNKKIDYRNHMQTHTCIEPVPCALCGRCFSVKSAVYRHIAEDHDCQKLYTCSICNRGFKYSKPLEKHLKNNHGMPYYCRKCGSNFRDITTLHKHLTSHSEKQHVCEVCDEVYFEKWRLRLHMKDHKAKLDGETLELISHTRTELSDIPTTSSKPWLSGHDSHTCEVCAMGFTGKQTFLKHMKAHASNSGEDSSCSKDDEPTESTYTNMNKADVLGCSIESDVTQVADSSGSSSDKDLEVSLCSAEIGSRPTSSCCSCMQLNYHIPPEQRVGSTEPSDAATIGLSGIQPSQVKRDCVQCERKQNKNDFLSHATHKVEKAVHTLTKTKHRERRKSVHKARMKFKNYSSLGQKYDSPSKVVASDLQDCSVKISALYICLCEHCGKLFDSFTFKRHGKGGRCLFVKTPTELRDGLSVESQEGGDVDNMTSTECESNTNAKGSEKEFRGNKKRPVRKKNFEYDEEDEKLLNFCLREHGCGRLVYPCLRCKYVFAEEEFLEKHSRRHKEEKTTGNDDSKPYRCELCARSFVRREGLICHMGIHTKPCLACNICHVVILAKPNALRHAKMHYKKREIETEENPTLDPMHGVWRGGHVMQPVN